ncbi:hypothetical protein E3N88_25572 [Mikania micrantha]|uniref:Uncharacterized protein n=1 Tax=Mikania micrantha TaxID=192012 RepID=A0A5N6N5A6_9ASTR|nr:hypothetical protein E3N88_25572 [Mikania micrantha]
MVAARLMRRGLASFFAKRNLNAEWSVDNMREMVNIGENRARNGVPDCPESQNEENSKNVKVKGSRRYA